MLKTGQKILEDHIIGDLSHCKLSHVGVDLTLLRVDKIITSSLENSTPFISKEKTVIPKNVLSQLFPTKNQNGQIVFYLTPGFYEFTMNEGVKLDSKSTALAIQRSSLSRVGTVSAKAIFDPGFETLNIGTTFQIMEPIIIEQHARVCQLIVMENYPTSMYDGQYQNDKQRKA